MHKGLRVGAKVIALKQKRLDSELSWAEVSEADLVERARNGDRRAAGELFERHHQQVYNLAFWMCGGVVEDAKDITQEAFLKALKNLEGFRGDSSFYTWLYKIAINVCLDNRKKAGRWKRLFPFFTEKTKSKDDGHRGPDATFEAPDGHTPLESLEDKEFRQAVRKEFLSLPEKQRLVFYLKVYQEMSVKEISEFTGLAHGTVKTHLFRAMKAMRRGLKKWVSA